MCPDNTCALDRVEVAEEAVEVTNEDKGKAQEQTRDHQGMCSPEKKLLGNRRPSRKFERLYRIGEVICLLFITDHLRLIVMNDPVAVHGLNMF